MISPTDFGSTIKITQTHRFYPSASTYHYGLICYHCVDKYNF